MNGTQAGALLGALTFGLVLLYNTVTLSRLESRIAALEEAPVPGSVAAQAAPAHEAPGTGRPPTQALRSIDAPARVAPSEANGIELSNPEVRETLEELMEESRERRWEERRQEWAQRWTEDMNDEVAYLADTQGWDSETTEKLRSELTSYHTEAQAIREDMWTGGMSRYQARDDLQRVRDQTATRMSAFLDEAALELVRERFLTSRHH